MNKFKKAGIVSLATFIFLLVASAVALALGYVRLEHESYGWLFLIVGVILLILSGLVAFVVRGNTAVNLACFAANAVALGFCIRAWYFFRGWKITLSPCCSYASPAWHICGCSSRYVLYHSFQST